MGNHKNKYVNGVNPDRISGMLIPGGRYGYRLEFRREDAAERAAARSKRSPEEQLALLDRRLGKGKGARKERARLNAMIEDSATNENEEG